MIEKITSPSNSKFKIWKELLTSKGIREHKLCLVSGQKIVEELLSDKNLINCVLTTSQDAPTGVKGFELSKELFNELDIFGTHTPLLIVKTPDIEKSDSAEPKGLEIVAPLQDPSNLGALIRSAAAFGASRLWLTTESANPFLPKTIRASSGLSLKLSLGVLTTSSNKNDAGLDMDGLSLQDFKWPKNIRLWIGEEGRGLQNFPGSRLKIEMSRQVESLNATIAASVALFSYRQQHPLKGQP